MRNRILLLAAVVFLGLLSLLLLAVVVWRGVQRPQNPVPSRAATNQALDFCRGNVNAPPKCFDCNGDGVINILDFSCFAKHYGKNVPPEEGPSGIYGKASVGPTCPGPQQIGTQAGQVCVQPYVGTIIIKDASTSGEVSRFDTADDGSFRVTLPAGDYLAARPAGLRTVSKTQIHVDENKFTNIDIFFDTGIR